MRQKLNSDEIAAYLDKFPSLEGAKTRGIALVFKISTSSAYQKLRELEKQGKVVKETLIENGHATHRWFSIGKESSGELSV
jgi:hypothetical protein